MHSPVLIDYDPTLELDDLDEWELYPSDFFDEDVPTTGKRKRNLDRDQRGDEGVLKRRKVVHTDAIPELRLGEPAATVPKVIWRSSEHEPLIHPVVDERQAEKISLLKDWRERFKDSGQDSFFQMPRKIKKTMLAVVIERRPSQDGNRDGMPPPSVGTKSQNSNSGAKKSEPIALVNRTSARASPLANQRQKPTPSTNGAASATSTSKKGSQTASKGRKRKASELDEFSDTNVFSNGDTHDSDNPGLPESQNTLPTKPKAPAPGRKRKAATPEPEAQPPAKRATTVRNGVVGARVANVDTKGANATKTSTRRSARRK